MGVAAIGLMADGAHDVDLIALIIEGITHRLAIDSQSLVIPVRIGYHSNVARLGRSLRDRHG